MSKKTLPMQDNPFRHAAFRRLFAAQVIALVGTGLSTVGLQLLAYRLTGGQAAPVLATALSIKMIAYVFLAPICGGLAHRTSRKSILVTSDVIRAGMVLLLPFVTTEWQIYLLIFAVHALSAAFKPVFQAIIPTVLPDNATYTRALSWTRLAYDLETVGSMMLAITLMAAGSGFELLFELNSAAFLISALLIIVTRLPKIAPRRANRPGARRRYLRRAFLHGHTQAAGAAGALLRRRHGQRRGAGEQRRLRAQRTGRSGLPGGRDHAGLRRRLDGRGPHHPAHPAPHQKPPADLARRAAGRRRGPVHDPLARPGGGAGDVGR